MSVPERIYTVCELCGDTDIKPLASLAEDLNTLSSDAAQALDEVDQVAQQAHELYHQCQESLAQLALNDPSTVLDKRYKIEQTRLQQARLRKQTQQEKTAPFATR